jgi:inositol 1,4,5-triphosphate receptor type 3
MGENECKTLAQCYVTFIYNGLLHGGGIGDYLAYTNGNAPNLAEAGLYNQDYFFRVLFDLSFFIVVLILFLNLIFGVIIDTFGQLRDQAATRKKAKHGRCLVCSIPTDVSVPSPFPSCIFSCDFAKGEPLYHFV